MAKWRQGFAVLAVYVLVLQAVLAGAATSASLTVGDGRQGVICRGDSWRSDTGEGGTSRHELGGNCACQGLCPQHAGAGIGPVVAVAWTLPRPSAGRLLDPGAIAVPQPRIMRRASPARAPPRLGSRFT